MEIGERGTSKKDDHNVVPLPFCESNLMLLNNKKQSIQRLMGLKRSFMKNNKFLQDHHTFMDQSVKKWLCKKVRYITIRDNLVYPSPWSVPPG